MPPLGLEPRPTSLSNGVGNIGHYDVLTRRRQQHNLVICAEPVRLLEHLRRTRDVQQGHTVVDEDRHEAWRSGLGDPGSAGRSYSQWFIIVRSIPLVCGPSHLSMRSL